MNHDMKSMFRDALILFAITLIAGLVLGVVYQVTKEPIAAQQEKAKQEACREVFAEAAQFNGIETVLPAGNEWTEQGFAGVSIGESMEALDAGGSVIGYVITVVSHEGYGGDITFIDRKSVV